MTTKERLKTIRAIIKKDSTRRMIHRISGSMSAMSIGLLGSALYISHNNPTLPFITLAIAHFIFYITDPD